MTEDKTCPICGGPWGLHTCPQDLSELGFEPETPPEEVPEETTTGDTV